MEDYLVECPSAEFDALARVICELDRKSVV